MCKVMLVKHTTVNSFTVQSKILSAFVKEDHCFWLSCIYHFVYTNCPFCHWYLTWFVFYLLKISGNDRSDQYNARKWRSQDPMWSSIWQSSIVIWQFLHRGVPLEQLCTDGVCKRWCWRFDTFVTWSMDVHRLPSMAASLIFASHAFDCFWATNT